MRRNLIIAAIAVVVIGVGVAVYFIFFTGGTPGVTTTPGTGLPTAGQGVPPITTTPAAPAAVPGAPTAVSARLVKISAGPVVPGEAVINTRALNATSSSGVVVTYIERQSGNVYSYSTRSRTITRTSNKTLPGIQSASWLPNASLAFVRYLSGGDFSTINTYALPSGGAGTSTAVQQGFFLPQNLAGIDVSAADLLTTVSGVNGSSVSLVRTNGTRSSQLFTTPLSSIRASFAGRNQYLVYTKPSSDLSGYAFLVDGAGRFSRVAGPLAGLVALASPSGKWVLVSYSLAGAMQMELVDTTTRASLPLPVSTIADKCVWANNDSAVYCGIPITPPAGEYPDDWYQGAAHFSDRIWKIDTAGRYAQLVLDFNRETDEALDAEALALDSLATTLVFVNRNDGSLWSYAL